MQQLIDTRLDGHVHTRLCLHARGEMEEYVLAAMHRGLACVTFLEHLEAGIEYHHRTWLRDSDFSYYFREGERLKKKYRGRIRVRLGIEVGYNPEQADQLRELLAGYPAEVVGLSYHFYRIGQRHYNLVSRAQVNLEALSAAGADRVATDYFATLLEAVQNLDADFVCHLDAVLRHLPEMRLHEGHRQQIGSLLDAMAARKMLLEVNTSGVVNRGAPYPQLEVIAEAMHRGIKLQAGSDAHTPDDVARYFDRLPELVTAAASLRHPL